MSAEERKRSLQETREEEAKKARHEEERKRSRQETDEEEAIGCPSMHKTQGGSYARKYKTHM